MLYEVYDIEIRKKAKIRNRYNQENLVSKTVKAKEDSLVRHGGASLRLRGYKTFSWSTQLSMKFILLINVKMPTIIGILTFISMKNTISERLKARNFFICRYFSFYEQLKFRSQLSWACNKFYNLGARNQPTMKG